MRKQYCLLIIILFLSGCSENRFKTFDLKGVEVETNCILNPHVLYIADSLLIIKEGVTGAKSLKILNLNDFRFITEAAWLGKGPGEISNPGGIMVSDDNETFWFCDWGKNRIFNFPIDSVLNNPDFRPEEYIPVKKEWVPYMNKYCHPSGNIGFATYALPNNLVSYINTRGSLVDSMSIPNRLKVIWEDMDFMDIPYILAYNQNKKIFFVADRYKNNIAIVDEKGNIIKNVNNIPIPNHKSAKGNNNQGFKSFYTLAHDELFVYCLYRGGQSLVYDLEYAEKYGELKANYPTRILVFDWEGNMKAIINLDYPLIDMVLDKKRQRIIGHTEELENALVSFDITNLYDH